MFESADEVLDELEGAAEAEDTEESQDTEDDPLAGLDDEVKARVQAAIEAETKRLNEEFGRHKLQYGRRFGKTIENAKAKGLVITDDGDVAVLDPQQAAKALGISVAEAREMQQQQAPEDDETPPDPVYDPAGHRAWVQKQAAKANEPLLQKLERLESLLSQTTLQQALPTATLQAREYLSGKGLGELAETEQFQDIFARALQSIPEAQRGTPTAVRVAAMMAIPALEEALEEEGAAAPTPTRRPSAAAAAVAASRAGLAQIGASRDAGRNRDSSEDEQMARFLTELTGTTTTPEERRALAAGDQDLYLKLYNKRTRGRR